MSSISILLYVTHDLNDRTRIRPEDLGAVDRRRTTEGIEANVYRNCFYRYQYLSAKIVSGSEYGRV